MDFVKFKERISQGIQKYKYVCIVLFAGLILMMIPGKKTEVTTQNLQEVVVSKEEFTTQEQLENILSYVDGAGKVRVMLSIAQGERTIYQTDSTYSQTENSTDTRTQTILISDGQRNETGLIHQKSPPVYQGAIILAQGADIPSVELAIVEAVSNITGLGADRISVLKMK